MTVGQPIIFAQFHLMGPYGFPWTYRSNCTWVLPNTMTDFATWAPNAISGLSLKREPRPVAFDTPQSSLMAASSVDHPFMKLRHSFLSMCFSICKVSMRTGLIWFHFMVSVSFAEENICSHSTDIAWTKR